MADRNRLPGGPETSILLPLGFTLAHPQVDTAITGTRNSTHLRANVELAEHNLPLQVDVVQALRRRFEEIGRDWPQMG